MKCSSFWIAGLNSPLSIWDFSVFWKKNLEALGVNYSPLKQTRFKLHPNEVIPGLMCYMHLIWLIMQSCMGTHRKLWTPDVIHLVKTFPCSESQCQAYALPRYNLISVLETWMIGLTWPFFVCTLVTVTCSFTGIYPPVIYKQSPSAALFFFFLFIMHVAQDLQLLSTRINTETTYSTNLPGQFCGFWPFFSLRTLKNGLQSSVHWNQISKQARKWFLPTLFFSQV